MNELQFLAEVLDKATQKGTFSLAETTSITRALGLLKAKLEKLEQFEAEEKALKKS